MRQEKDKIYQKVKSRTFSRVEKERAIVILKNLMEQHTTSIGKGQKRRNYRFRSDRDKRYLQLDKDFFMDAARPPLGHFPLSTGIVDCYERIGSNVLWMAAYIYDEGDPEREYRGGKEITEKHQTKKYDRLYKRIDKAKNNDIKLLIYRMGKVVRWVIISEYLTRDISIIRNRVPADGCRKRPSLAQMIPEDYYDKRLFRGEVKELRKVLRDLSIARTRIAHIDSRGYEEFVIEHGDIMNDWRAAKRFVIVTFNASFVLKYTEVLQLIDELLETKC